MTKAKTTSYEQQLETLEELSLAEKIAKANAEIGSISKDGKNNFQRYSFQSEAAIKAAVQRVSSKNGFIIIPNYKILRNYTNTTKKGQQYNFVDVLGTFTVTDGKDKYIGSMPGTGSDTGDKAVQKGCTIAQKYFYKQLFNISDKDEDPDADNSQPDGGYEQTAPRSVARVNRSSSTSKPTVNKTKPATSTNRTISDNQLLDYEITDTKGKVKLVQVIAEAVAGNFASQNTLGSLNGKDKKAYKMIYERGLYKSWLK